FEFGVQLAFQAQQDMALAAPVVGQVAGRVFDHAHADVAELAGAPIRLAGVARVFGGFDRLPIGGAEGDIAQIHAGDSLLGRAAGSSGTRSSRSVAPMSMPAWLSSVVACPR